MDYLQYRFIAGFLAWSDEHNKVNEKQEEINRLAGELRDTSRARQEAERIQSEVAAKMENLAQSNEQLRGEVARLQERFRPRQIVRRKEFIQALREAGPSTLDLNYVGGEGDAAELFGDLHDLLIAGGWTIRNKAVLPGGSWKGVLVVVKDRNVTPPGAALIVELLRQNGIGVGLVEHPANVTLTADTFSVEIGYRP